MNDDTPPPITQQSLVAPEQPPEPLNMKSRWIAWVLASVVMPALPWLTYSNSSKDDGAGVLVLTLFALLLQLAASIAVAIGFCKRRSIGVGGVIGMTIAFMAASVAIGTAMWFAVCVSRVSMDYR